MIVDEEGRDKAEVNLTRHESDTEQQHSSELHIQFPRPTKLKNDTRSRKNRSKNQERELARSARLAGFSTAKRVPGSGALAGLPADVDYGEWFLGEAKETRTGRLTIDPEWIKKISNQARQVGRPWWVLHAWVGGETGPYNKVVIMDEKHFFGLMRQLNDSIDT